MFGVIFFMCTAICCDMGHCYFGRNLDLEYNYTETVTITPRNFTFEFENDDVMKRHYAMIVIEYVADGYPLYYDAVNEKGVAMAGLSFDGFAYYNKPCVEKNNIASYELIPYILCCCGDMCQVIDIVNNLNITDAAFSQKLPPSPLHWIVSYKGESMVIEQTEWGFNIYDNPIGVLTNNPEFPYHMQSLNNYMSLSPSNPKNNFGYEALNVYSKGMGAIGLPGDNSSNSRFVRAAFTKCNSVSCDSEESKIGRFFHMLDSVAQVKGTTRVEEEQYEITVYSSCCNCDRGIYYYTTYENRQISAVDMYRESLEGTELISYPIYGEENVRFIN